jgi:hypothetical protein
LAWCREETIAATATSRAAGDDAATAAIAAENRSRESQFDDANFRTDIAGAIRGLQRSSC